MHCTQTHPKNGTLTRKIIHQHHADHLRGVCGTCVFPLKFKHTTYANPHFFSFVIVGTTGTIGTDRPCPCLCWPLAPRRAHAGTVGTGSARLITQKNDRPRSPPQTVHVNYRQAGRPQQSLKPPRSARCTQADDTSTTTTATTTSSTSTTHRRACAFEHT